MRIARIPSAAGPRYALAAEGRWRAIADPFAAPAGFGSRHRLAPLGEDIGQSGEDLGPVEGTITLAPCVPRVILGMAHNGSPGDREIPRQAFHKSARTAVGPGEAIVIEPWRGRVVAEAELAVVIGRHCRNVPAARAAEVIAGYTIGNDVTAVDQVGADEKMVQSKSGRGYTPLGPWIDTELDPASVPLVMSVNGRRVVESDTARLAWNIAEQIEYLSRYLELGPGDVILSGAPESSAEIRPGDTVRLELGALGALQNPVTAPEESGEAWR